MRVNVIGTRKVKFADKNTGELVEYTELHCTTTDKYVVGQRVLVVKVANDKVVALKVPGEYDFDFAPLPSGKAQLIGITPVK